MIGLFQFFVCFAALTTVLVVLDNAAAAKARRLVLTELHRCEQAYRQGSGVRPCPQIDSRELNGAIDYPYHRILSALRYLRERDYIVHVPTSAGLPAGWILTPAGRRIGVDES
jgi:hypothetical protein